MTDFFGLLIPNGMLLQYLPVHELFGEATFNTKRDNFNDNSIAAGFIHWNKLQNKYAQKI